MKSVVVIDNFYRDPYAVRDFALNKATYFSREHLPAQFTGTESEQSFTTSKVVQKIESAIGERVLVDSQSYSFGVFCKTSASDQARRTIHLDNSDWTGLLYLSRPEDCAGGTVLYRHRETGLESVPSDQELKSLGYANRADFIERFVIPEGADGSKWTPSLRVGMKFNRMFLFRANQLFHAAEGYFGTNDENCRLTQLFFFKTEATV